METILIIDSDLGFTLWLGEALCAAGHAPLPATRISEAVAVSRLARKIDLVIVNPSLDGALDFVDRLRCEQDDLKVLAVIDETADDIAVVSGVDAGVRKPKVADNGARTWWQGIIRQLLIRYCAA
jgi:DNA-binding response OmpR family regulator